MKKNKLNSIVTIGALVLVMGALLSCSQQHNPLQTLPNAAESEQIAIETTLQFARAVNAKDLSLFRNQTTEEFKKQFSHEQFNNTFKGFIQQNINLLPIAKLKPIFHFPAALTKDKNLILSGYFPSRPSKVSFSYSYIWRSNQWKVTGIKLDVIPTSNN